MDIRTSLVLKYNGPYITANIMIGNHTIANATENGDQRKAIAKVINQYRDAKSISNIFISKDFTKDIELDQTIDNILYIRILPEGDSWQKKEAYFSDGNDISSKVTALDLVYNQKGDYTNFDDIVKHIDDFKPKSIALNYVHTTKFSNIEFAAYNMLKSKYPKVLIYPSTNLLNRNFIVRGNTQLLNLVLTPKIKSFLQVIKSDLSDLDIDAPLYFLRTHKGLVGQNTILTQGIDTCGCEEYLYVCDCAKLMENSGALLTDFDSGYLYHIKNKIPNMILTTIDLANSKVLGWTCERHHLNLIHSESELKRFLDKRTPYLGTMPMYVIGKASFKISDLFSYPITQLNRLDSSISNSIRSMLYQTEAEVFIGESDNVDIARTELRSILIDAATSDGLSADENNLTSVLVPMKYLKKSVYAKGNT